MYSACGVIVHNHCPIMGWPWHETSGDSIDVHRKGQRKNELPGKVSLVALLWASLMEDPRSPFAQRRLDKIKKEQSPDLDGFLSDTQKGKPYPRPNVPFHLRCMSIGKNQAAVPRLKRC